MFSKEGQEIQTAKTQLQAAQSELDDLEKQLESFEAQVDARLGNLLDQLSVLNAETADLDDQLRRIREERLFGSDLMHYLDGAPQPARRVDPDDLPPMGLTGRESIREQSSGSATPPQPQVPDIKTLYRKLARRYHPDLARTDTDRAQSNDQMKLINQAYADGDMSTLMKIAGVSPHSGLGYGQAPLRYESRPLKFDSELEETQYELRQKRHQINRLSSLPIIKLSLDVKLARHQGRDLLREMSAELEFKIARKLAERDYLRSQIDASSPTIL